MTQVKIYLTDRTLLYRTRSMDKAAPAQSRNGRGLNGIQHYSLAISMHDSRRPFSRPADSHQGFATLQRDGEERGQFNRIQIVKPPCLPSFTSQFTSQLHKQIPAPVWLSLARFGEQSFGVRFAKGSRILNSKISRSLSKGNSISHTQS